MAEKLNALRFEMPSIETSYPTVQELDHERRSINEGENLLMPM